MDNAIVTTYISDQRPLLVLESLRRIIRIQSFRQIFRLLDSDLRGGRQKVLFYIGRISTNCNVQRG